MADRLAPNTPGIDRLREAPVGTKAPAIMGGAWLKVGQGRWQWNGGTRCPGSTFPRPGGDWNGDLIYPDGTTEVPHG